MSSDDCPYEMIIGRRNSKSTQTEYLIKLVGEPYKRSEWITSKKLKKIANLPTVITWALDNPSNIPSEEPYYDPEYDNVERIIAQDGKKYLVKWCKLPYSQCTWETKLSKTEISAFKGQQKLQFPDKHGNIHEAPSFEHIYLSEYNVYGQTLEPQQLVCVNSLIEDYQKGTTSELIDHLDMNLHMGAFGFLECIYDEADDLGPFLVITSASNTSKWYNMFAKSECLVPVELSGPKEHRAIVLEHAFIDNSKLKFHVCVTTHDMIQQETELLESVKWRVAICDEAQRMKNPQSRLFKAFSRLDIGHIVKITTVPVRNYVPQIKSAIDLLSDNAREIGRETAAICSELKGRLDYAIENASNFQEKEVVERLPLYISCPMSPVQMNVTKSVLVEDMKLLKAGEYEIVCQKLLRILNHPFLLFGRESLLPNVDFRECSTKLRVLDAIIRDSLLASETVIVLSQFSIMLDLVEDLAIANGTKFERIKSQANLGVERPDSKLILYNPRFCEISSDLFDVIDRVVLLDCDAPDFLAQFDAHPVVIYRLICNDCSEKDLISVCSGNNNDIPQATTKRLCRIAAIYANISKDIPTVEELLALASPVEPKNQFLWLERELDDTIWDDIEYTKEEVGEREERDWSCREREQLVRSLSAFGWNRWDKLLAASGLHRSLDDVIQASHVVLRETTRKAGLSSYQMFRDILDSECDADADKQFMESTVFGDQQFKVKLHKMGNQFIKRLEVIHYLDEVFSSWSENKEDWFRGSRSAVVPADWWTDDHDYSLCVGILTYGFDNYDHFAIDPNLKFIKRGVEFKRCNDRVMALGDAIRRFITQERKEREKEKDTRTSAKTESPAGAHQEPMGMEIDAKWSKDAKAAIYHYLQEFGIPVNSSGERDFEYMHKALNIQDKTAEDLSEYVTDFLARCEVPQEIGGVPPKTAHSTRMRVIYMQKVRDIIAGKSKQDIIDFFQRVPRWKSNVPEGWTQELEALFYYELSERGYSKVGEIVALPEFQGMFDPQNLPVYLKKTNAIWKRIDQLYEVYQKPEATVDETFTVPSMEQLEKNEVTFPLQLPSSAQLWSLGEIVTDRNEFHTNRYIYPAGYRISRMWTSLDKPKQKVRWFGEIIDDGKPLFRIWMENNTDKVFEGRTPAAPCASAANEICKKMKPKSKPASVSGVEWFMLNSPIVTFLVQRLPGADKLEKYSFKPIKDLEVNISNEED